MIKWPLEAGFRALTFNLTSSSCELLDKLLNSSRISLSVNIVIIMQPPHHDPRSHHYLALAQCLAYVRTHHIEVLIGTQKLACYMVQV